MELLMILLIWLVAPFAELVVIVVLAVINSRNKQKIQELTCQIEKLGYFRAVHQTSDLKMGGAEKSLEANPKVKKDDEEAQWNPGAQNRPEAQNKSEAQNKPEAQNKSEAQNKPEAQNKSEAQKKSEAQDNSEIQMSSESEWKADQWTVPKINQIAETESTMCLGYDTVSSVKHVPAQRKPSIPSVSGLFQGTAVLLIGVVFVVLAGLIFATTAWHVLPNIWKAVMVLGFSGLFFGASLAAGRVLKIERTSLAFYILGSIFLFLAVLAVGYFGLLGPEFILTGENRYRVLWIGSLVTEAALFVGIRRFRDRIYTQACFWGMTVSMTFLMGALKLGYAGGLNAMVYYSFLLLVWDERNRRKPDGFKRIRLPEVTEAGFGLFANIHFWIFGGLMAMETVSRLMEAVIGISIFGISRITIWSTAAVGLVAAGIAIIALRNKKEEMKIVHSICLAVFFQYAGFCVPVDFTYQVLIGAMMTGGWFLAERRIKSPLYHVAGSCIHTVVLALDTLLMLITVLWIWNGSGEQLAASAAVILLAGVMACWSRQYPVLRGSIAAVLFALTVTGYMISSRVYGLDLDYDMAVLIYVLAIAVWDVARRDRFWVPVLAVGTAAQIVDRMAGRDPLPFFILLSIYLLSWSFYKEDMERELCMKGSCLYSLAGVWLVAGSMTENGVVQMIWVTAALAVEYAVMCYRNRRWISTWFWDTAAMAVFLFTMAEFYRDSQLAIWNLVPCMISFVLIYVTLYRGGRIWPQLAVAVAVLPIPQVTAARYMLTENQIYGFTAAVILLSGALFRYYRPVMIDRENADWFHILLILPILLMMQNAGREWRCIYLLLTALYVLQYAMIKPWRKAAFTLAEVLALLAFWDQPFVRWPDLLWLEIQLVPAALLIWSLGRIWKETAWISLVQTILYGLCLAVMSFHAFCTGNVGDALILEVVCLIIFLWSHKNKRAEWIRISGLLLITVALYMTKDFWLSLSWWVYLLAVGLGLIIFAAFKEMKK